MVSRQVCTATLSYFCKWSKSFLIIHFSSFLLWDQWKKSHFLAQWKNERWCYLHSLRWKNHSKTYHCFHLGRLVSSLILKALKSLTKFQPEPGTEMYGSCLFCMLWNSQTIRTLLVAKPLQIYTECGLELFGELSWSYSRKGEMQ